MADTERPASPHGLIQTEPPPFMMMPLITAPQPKPATPEPKPDDMDSLGGKIDIIDAKPVDGVDPVMVGNDTQIEKGKMQLYYTQVLTVASFC